jgi:succinoglycan biosynthesis protein ExoM
MCTFDREIMARRTIESVYAQNLSAGLDFEMIVVDNTASGNARGWVASLFEHNPSPRYVHEPSPGISHARNAGVAAARGEFLAFIDDDETAEPDWLANLHRALIAHRADIVTGPVHPVFENKSSLGWDPTPFFYGKREAMPTGGELQSARTGNIMLRVATCFDGTPPFDPRLGRSGGEDTDFTHGLHRKGRKIIWVADAVIHEFWPDAKASLPAFLRRKLVTARNTTLVRITRSARPLPSVVAMAAKALVQLAVFSPLAAVSYPISRQFYARCAMQVMSALGKMTFWLRAGYYGQGGERT